MNNCGCGGRCRHPDTQHAARLCACANGSGCPDCAPEQQQPPPSTTYTIEHDATGSYVKRGAITICHCDDYVSAEGIATALNFHAANACGTCGKPVATGDHGCCWKAYPAERLSPDYYAELERLAATEDDANGGQ